MQSFCRFEHDLLRIAYCLVGQASRAEALGLMRGGLLCPACLSGECIELVQATLAKGTVRLLARGGWRRERFLKDDSPVEGRLWQRWSAETLGLSFTPVTVKLLIWLTTKNSVDFQSRRAIQRLPDPSLGDQFAIFLAFRAVEKTPVGEELRKLSIVAANPLCRLAFAEDISEASVARIDWTPWVVGPGVPIFEALQHELSERWIRMERNKMQSTRPESLLNIGLAQGRLLEELLEV